MTRIGRLALCSILAMLSGCMTYNEEMLRKVPEVKAPARAAVIETKVGDFIQRLNREGTNAGPLSNTALANQVIKLIMDRWEDLGIVADYGKPGEIKGTPDYTLILSGARDEEGSIGLAVLSGLTLMLLPTSSTLTYDLNVELIDNKTSRHYEAKAKNAVTTVMEILFLPALPFSWIGGKHAVDDIADHLYHELHAQGAFAQGAVAAKP